MAEDPKKPGSTRALVALLAFVLGFATIPHRVCERDARAWFAGAPARADALARSVERPSATSFATGSPRFDGEWRLAMFVMGAMGFGQLAIEHEPETNLDAMERCLDAMLERSVRSFDTEAWHADALEESAGHVGFLGYAALPLALHEVLRPGSRFASQESAMVGALVRRIDASPAGLVETYPGETYPVDNAAALAAIALHHRARHAPPPAALERGIEALKRTVDPRSGLMAQAVTATGVVRDAPRASGTALASYFLSFADGPLSRALFIATSRQFRTVLGFGGILEVPRGSAAAEDIDSGPVVLGFGVSASGFALGASRVHGDFDTFRAVLATAHLFGAPLDENGTRTYAFGGPLGDAILFAMLTAPRLGRLG
jgi:hypothetical protein